MRQPVPGDEQRLRERWRRVGRALLAALAAVGATWSGHVYRPPGRDRDDRG
jgi:hypothetical protein